MSTNGKTLKFRAAKLKGFTVFQISVYQTDNLSTGTCTLQPIS